MTHINTNPTKRWMTAGLVLTIACALIGAVPALAANDPNPTKLTTLAKEKSEQAVMKKEREPLTTIPDKIKVEAKEKDLLERINAERKKAGAAPLSINATLQKVAHIRGMEVMDSFSHTRPNGSMFYTAFKDVGQSEEYYTAENLSAGRTEASQVCQGWMDSEGHKVNMLNPIYTSVGVKHVAVEAGKTKYEDYWVLVLQGEGK